MQKARMGREATKTPRRANQYRCYARRNRGLGRWTDAESRRLKLPSTALDLDARFRALQWPRVIEPDGLRRIEYETD